MAVRGPNETDRGVRGVFLVQIGGVALRDNELGAPFPDGAGAVLRYRSVDRGLRMGVGTVEFRKGVQHRVGVGWRVDLGDHHDVASSGIGDDAAVLLLSVEPGATQLIAVAVFLGVHCGVSGHRGEFRVVESVTGCAALVGDLDPPALIVGQVHV